MLSRQFSLSSFDLLRDFAALPTLFPDDFKVENEPVARSASFTWQCSINRCLSYNKEIYAFKKKGKMIVRGDTNVLVLGWYHEDYSTPYLTIIKLASDEGETDEEKYDWTSVCYLEYSWWKSLKFFFIDISKDGEEIMVTSGSGEKADVARYYKYMRGADPDYDEEEDSWCFERDWGELRGARRALTHVFQKLYELRKDADASFVHVVHGKEEKKKDEENEEEDEEAGHADSTFYLLTVKKTEDEKFECVVRAVKGDYADKKDPQAAEVTVRKELVLAIDPAINATARDVVDFKVAEGQSQIRLMMQLRDKGEFEFFGFNSESGQMTTSFEYSNKVAQEPDTAE